MPTTLQTFPPELRDAILSYILRPTDLKSLCLTSKLLRSLATPKLYHDVVLDLTAVEKNAGFLVHRHPGHLHVKELGFLPLDPDDPFDGEAAQRTIRFALQLLPRDSLIGFDLPFGMICDGDTFMTLFTQQRALNFIHFASVQGMPPVAFHTVHAWLSKLQRLDMPREVCEHDLDFYGQIIRTCDKLNTLGIRAAELRDETPVDAITRDLDDTEHQDGLIFEKLFGHLTTGRTTGCDERLGLQNLWFDDTELSYSDRTFTQVIKFEGLCTLNLVDCCGVDVLLQQLTALFKLRGSALRGFIYWNTLDEYTEASTAAMHDFLLSFANLEYLQIADTDPSCDFDMRCLSNHLPTIRDLYIGKGGGINGEEHWLATLEDLRMLRQCTKLQQLAIALPRPTLPLGSDESWQCFWTTIVSNCIDALATSWFTDIQQEHLRDLRSLEILQILTWPKPPAIYKFSQSDAFKPIYERDVDDFATQVLRSLERGGDDQQLRIGLLCIGDSNPEDSVRSEDGEIWKEKSTACYLVGREVDPFGNVRPIAVPTESHLVEYVEPLWAA